MVFNVRIEKIYIHPEYDLIADTNEMTNTGLMIVFKLESKNPDLSSFAGRWDQKQGVLDIGIFKVDGKAVANFRAEKNGYGGHHPLVIVSGNVPDFKQFVYLQQLGYQS